MPANKVLGPSLLDSGGDSDAKALREIVTQVFSTKNMSLKSNLTTYQVTQLVRGLMYAKHFKCKNMTLVVNSVLELTVSDKGLGRKDMRTVLQSMLVRMQRSQTDSKLQDKLL